MILPNEVFSPESRIEVRKNGERRLFVAILLVGFLPVSCGIAFATTDGERVYHGFSIEVGRGLPPVSGVRFHYGDLGWLERPRATSVAPFTLVNGVMTVPEIFEVSWISEAGASYHFKVPVLSKLPASARGKKVSFVLMSDHVEGYLVTREERGQEQRVRFY
jgi:hypothetical protein